MSLINAFYLNNDFNNSIYLFLLIQFGISIWSLLIKYNNNNKKLKIGKIDLN